MTVSRDITFQKFQCTSTTSRDNVNALTLSSSSSYKEEEEERARATYEYINEANSRTFSPLAVFELLVSPHVAAGVTFYSPERNHPWWSHPCGVHLGRQLHFT